MEDEVREQEPGSDGLITQIGFGLEDLGSILSMGVGSIEKARDTRFLRKWRLGMGSRAPVEGLF